MVIIVKKNLVWNLWYDPTAQHHIFYLPYSAIFEKAGSLGREKQMQGIGQWMAWFFILDGNSI